MKTKHAPPTSFRIDRRLLVALAGDERGAWSALVKRLLAEEARRQGIEVVAPRPPQRAA